MLITEKSASSAQARLAIGWYWNPPNIFWWTKWWGTSKVH